MTESSAYDTPPTPGGTAGSTLTPPPPPGPRKFRRSRNDRVLAGVCGGLAESLAMDPVIVRVLMVVLTVFGGAGVIVYLACWLLMPEDNRESSLAERAIARGGRNSWPVLALAGALGLAAVLGAGWVVDGRGVLLIALFVVAAILLARRDHEPVAAPFVTASVPTGAPTAGPPTAGAFAAPAPASWSSSDWSTTATAPLPPLPPEPPRPRSLLGRVTFCLILVALGLLATIDLLGADIDASAYPAVVIAGAGLGLLAGTWYGRGRWLIPLGVLGVLALPPTLFVDQYDGTWVDQEHSALAPADVASIQPEYSYRGGRVLLDLSAVNFTGQNAATKVRMGAGELIITVPANVDVVHEVDLGVGDAEVFDAQHDGSGVEVDGRDEGADGPGGGTLTLDVEQGFGHLEVRRAAA